MPSSPRPRRARRGSGQTTLADVAKVAGVTAITVSRAINSPALVSPTTLARVQAAVQRLHYVPNLLAGGLASTRHALVVAIVPTVASPMFAGTIDALDFSLRAQGLQLMVGLSGYSAQREDEILTAALSRRPAGIVLTGAMQPGEARERLAAARIPVVETWDLTDDPLGLVVGFSPAKIGAAVARHLHAQGARRLAILTGDDRRALLRADGLIRQARKLGVPDVPLLQVSAPTTVSHGRQGLSDLLAAHPEIDAVACSSDNLALGLLHEAQARGLAVPSRLRVMGFGDLPFAAAAHPALSTVRVDGAEMGRRAAEYILAQRQRPPRQEVIDLGFELIVRAST